jgi:hypothetical protein
MGLRRHGEVTEVYFSLYTGIVVVAVMLVTTYLMTFMVWPQASDGGHSVSGGVLIS